MLNMFACLLVCLLACLLASLCAGTGDGGLQSRPKMAIVCDCDLSQDAKQIATVEEVTTTQISLLHGCLGMSTCLRNIALEGTSDCVVDGMPALDSCCRYHK